MIQISEFYFEEYNFQIKILKEVQAQREGEKKKETAPYNYFLQLRAWTDVPEGMFLQIFH